MARNIPVPRETYQNFRHWIRTTQILWRDLSDAAFVPSWGEAVCREDILDENQKTPGERAFNAIKHCYPKLDLRWRKEELEYLAIRPPKYFSTQYRGDLFCLDIQSAFNQIYRKLFFHADYPTKRLKYPLGEIAKILKDDKLGRNAVVGVARSTRNKWCQGERVWYTKKQNRYLSPVLWAHINLILSQAAHFALSCGAIHINTDGFAFDNQKGMLALKEKLEDCGLKLREYSGEGHIIGISALSIEGIKEPAEFQPSKPVNQIEPVNFDWLEWWKNLT